MCFFKGRVPSYFSPLPPLENDLLYILPLFCRRALFLCIGIYKNTKIDYIDPIRFCRVRG